MKNRISHKILGVFLCIIFFQPLNYAQGYWKLEKKELDYVNLIGYKYPPQSVIDATISKTSSKIITEYEGYGLCKPQFLYSMDSNGRLETKNKFCHSNVSSNYTAEATTTIITGPGQFLLPKDYDFKLNNAYSGDNFPCSINYKAFSNTGFSIYHNEGGNSVGLASGFTESSTQFGKNLPKNGNNCSGTRQQTATYHYRLTPNKFVEGQKLVILFKHKWLGLYWHYTWVNGTPPSSEDTNIATPGYTSNPELANKEFSCSDFGTIKFNSDGSSANYAKTKKITGKLSGNRFEGWWYYPEGSSIRKCLSQKLGSSYWGRIVFDYDQNTDLITGGRWGYCNSDPNTKISCSKTSTVSTPEDCILNVTWYDNNQRHVILQSGNSVSAKYYNVKTGELIGTYKGAISDNVLEASWISSTKKGRIKWRLRPDCNGMDEIWSSDDSDRVNRPESSVEKKPEMEEIDNTDDPVNTPPEIDSNDPTNLGKTCSYFSRPTVYIECRKPRKDDYIRVPVKFCGARDLANMDFHITYNSSVLKFQSATKGSLVRGFFDYKKVSGRSKVNFSFASGSRARNGDGTIAILYFKVLASSGSSTISGYVSTAQNSKGKNLGVHEQNINGCQTTVVASPPPYSPDDDINRDDPDGPWNDPAKAPLGCDCDGNGLPDSYEARAAISFSVGKNPAGFSKDCLDVNRNGKTNSEDARLILQGAVGEGICGAAVRKKWGVGPNGQNTTSTNDTPIGVWVLGEPDPTKYPEVRELMKEYRTLATACLRKIKIGQEHFMMNTEEKWVVIKVAGYHLMNQMALILSLQNITCGISLVIQSKQTGFFTQDHTTILYTNLFA